MGTTIFRAFVSSTYEDLKGHRAYVIKELRAAGIFIDPMEDWAAASDEPKVFSSRRVQDCDFCVLLVAMRRGYVPEGDTRSITQLEYDAAIARGMDVLVFLLDENAPWIRRFDERGDALNAWRAHLQKKHGCSFFGQAPETIEIAPAVTRWVAEHARRTNEVGFDWVPFVSNLLHLPPNDPNTFAVAARLLPHAVAAVERAYIGHEVEPRSNENEVPSELMNSKATRTLVESARDFIHDARARFEALCFVVMPFGKKLVGNTIVDFDFAYSNVFKPAMARCTLPDGRPLTPMRSDEGLDPGWRRSQVEYLEYSRLVLCDITQANPSVFYELGVRYHARSSGTVLVWQRGQRIGFDVGSLRLVEVEYETSPSHIEESRAELAAALSHALMAQS